MPVDPLLLLVIRVGVAVLFAAAAMHKLRDRHRIGAVISGYRVLPAAMGGAVAPVVTALELAIATGALIANAALHAAAALLVAYAAAIALNILRGNDRIDCGCLGFGVRAPRLRWAMVTRNVLIAALAEFAAVATASARPLLWIDFVSLAAALLVLATLYAAYEAALGLSERGVA